METEILKTKLPDYLERITVKERSGLYHCPLCGSGTHRGDRSDGAFSVFDNGTRWHCFACNQSGDLFTLIGLIEGIGSFPEQIRFASELFGVPVSDSGAKHSNPQHSPEKPAVPKQPVKTDYHAYITKCAQDVSKTNYWTQERGFSEEIIRRFQLGFDPEKQAVVIPYDSSHTYYMTRSVQGKTFRKPRTIDAGVEPIYHRAALYQAEKPCFVCESPIDAISVMAAGEYPAIAVGGTGARKLLSQIDEKPPLCPLILCFDEDDAGRKASAHLAAELEQRSVPFAVAEFDLSVYPEHSRKDANDFYRGNRDAFARQIAQNADMLLRRSAAVQDEARSDHEAFTGAFRLSGFLSSIHGTGAAEAIPSGFADLDEFLDGGFFAGLYILGAISSLGKTTFLLQTADQIAAAGTDVLYFSLEMSAEELIAKSISRQTYLLCNDNTKIAKTVRGITTKSRYAAYSPDELKLIDRAVLAYQNYAGKLYYYEGIGNIGADEIRKKTEEHIRLTGRTPVVMIDYLQIMAPYDMRASDKQNTDKAVLELKRLSRDCKLPVIAISSLNRESYSSGEIEMSAFKESGAIEYGSDVLIGLQVQGLGGKLAAQENLKKIQQCKEHAIRNVELKILKNRNGRTGTKVGLRYYALFNCFVRDESYVQRIISDGIENDDFEPAF
ncbi:MAG: toprim domain-containing protein [Oscillospiraceae bacterium]|nr:toprim domain-containing protein [Oscillospiraceae bacterium]